MQHQPIAPIRHHAGDAWETFALLRPFERNARQCRPERSISTFHDHHAAPPTIKFVSIIFREGAHVPAVRIVEEESVRVVDDARSSQKMAQRRCPAIVHAANPRNHAIIRLHQILPILRRAIRARRFSKRLIQSRPGKDVRRFP